METEKMNRPASCHRCRRDRDHRSCMCCPRYGWRNLLESLELGTYVPVLGLLLLILLFSGLGVA